MLVKLLFLSVCVFSFCEDVYSEERIIGGRRTSGQFQFMAKVVTALSNNQTVYCGGSLIKDRWIITAAHCVDFPNIKRIIVCIGPKRQSVNYCNGHPYMAINFFKHEEYDNSTKHNDIALLKLEHSVKRWIAKPVSVATKRLRIEYSGLVCNAIGWGNTKLNASIDKYVESAYLKETGPMRLAYAYNLEAIRGSKFYSENELYAFSKGQRGLPSFGDTGGPLVITKRGHSILVGITSHEVDNKSEKLESYMKVENFIEWIDKTLKK